MPRTQPVLSGTSKLVKDLSQEALDLAEANVVYETQDDGDLMQLLFGVADEMPTMATIHIHKFPSPPPEPVGDLEENGAVAAADSGSASVAGDFCPRSGSSENGCQEAEGETKGTSGVGAVKQGASAVSHELHYHRRLGGMDGGGVPVGTCGHRLSSSADMETMKQQQHLVGCSGERMMPDTAIKGEELWATGLRSSVPVANGHEGYDSSFRLVLPTT